MPEPAAADESLADDAFVGARASVPAASVAHVGRRRLRDTLLIVLSRWRVQAGFILAGVALVLAEPRREAIVRTLPIVAAAIALRIWARGHLERRRYLTRSGPYAYVRHPLYVGSFVVGFVVALLAWFPVGPAVFTVVFLIAYFPKALREEAFLRARYGEEYERYASAVGAVLPRLRGLPADAPVDAARFRWRRVLVHGEWQTWIGAAVVFALLWARAR